MATAPRRRRRQSVAGLFMMALLGVAVMAGGAGYVVGNSQMDSRSFSPAQQEFLVGLVVGTTLRDAAPPHVTTDQLRATCAGRFYPARPLAMAGCISGLSSPPSGGYKLPPR